MTKNIEIIIIKGVKPNDPIMECGARANHAIPSSCRYFLNGEPSLWPIIHRLSHAVQCHHHVAWLDNCHNCHFSFVLMASFPKDLSISHTRTHFKSQMITTPAGRVSDIKGLKMRIENPEDKAHLELKNPYRGNVLRIQLQIRIKVQDHQRKSSAVLCQLKKLRICNFFTCGQTWDFSTSVMFRNQKFLHMTDLFVHRYFGDKYEVCSCSFLFCHQLWAGCQAQRGNLILLAHLSTFN